MLPTNKKLPGKGKGKFGGPDDGRPALNGAGGKGPKGGGKKHPLGGGKLPKYYGGRGGYRGVKTKGVRRLVNGVLRDELRDLRSQLRGVRQDSNEQARNARRDYRRGVGDLKYVHGETGDYINSLAARTQQTYGDQASQTAQANAALQSMLGQTYSGAQSGASEELARLGIEGGGNMGQIMADQANAQGMAAQSAANAQSTLGLAGSNSAAAMQMLAGMNQGSFMQGMGQNLNRRNDALQEIRTNRIDNINQVRHAMQDARSSRKDVFFQLLQQLQQTGWDQYIQQQQLNLQRRALRKH